MKKNNFRLSRLGDILLSEGVVSNEQLMEALSYQRDNGVRIGKALVDLGHITEEQLVETFSNGLKIPIKKINDLEIDKELIKKVPETLIKEHRFFPFEADEYVVKVLVNDPFNVVMEDELKHITGLDTELYLIYERDLEKLIDEYFDQQKVMKDLEGLSTELREQDTFDLNDDSANSPIVKIVNSIFKDAVVEGSSDIHIGPTEKGVEIRFRIDGILMKVKELPKQAHSALTSRIKTMASMDITEKRIPQDGRIQINIGNKFIDMRVNTIPTVYGEKTTLRLLDKQKMILNMDQLGFQDVNDVAFNKLIQNPVGIILITGPTGSGKSTTLYTVINELNDSTKNIMTVEDPVEYKLDGISQTQVNEKAGMTFASGLRALLRSDPDIILIGEIRDNETAKIAVKASNTGHLVFATLHTNDTVSSIMRLVDMDVERYLVASTVNGIANQRLVRRICSSCIEEYTSVDDTPDRLFFDVPEGEILRLYRGKGCEKCKGTGYKGRVAIHELLVMNDNLRRMIVNGAEQVDVKEEAVKSGLITLKQDGYQKAVEGLTTLEEVRKFVTE